MRLHLFRMRIISLDRIEMAEIHRFVADDRLVLAAIESRNRRFEPMLIVSFWEIGLEMRASEFIAQAALPLR